jgi:hypothetical protein
VKLSYRHETVVPYRDGEVSSMFSLAPHFWLWFGLLTGLGVLATSLAAVLVATVTAAPGGSSEQAAAQPPSHRPETPATQRDDGHTHPDEHEEHGEKVYAGSR